VNSSADKKKTLYVVRHAEAIGKVKGIPDFERSLVPKGVKGASTVARRLRKAGVGAQYLVSSPANRALETAHIFAQRFGIPNENVILKSGMYDDASAETLLSMLREIPDSIDTALIFGHDPSFSEFTTELVSGYEASLPKGAVAGILLPAAMWREISIGSGKLVYYDHPMSKTEQVRIEMQIRRCISSLLSDRVRDTFSSIDLKIYNRMTHLTSKNCRRLAESLIEETGLGALYALSELE